MRTTNSRIVLVVLLVFFVATLITGLILFFLLRPAQPSLPMRFADLQETDVPGRYKMTEGSSKEMFIVLYPDHTFMNEDGTVFRQYRWELGSNSFSLTWQRGTTVFTTLEGPGFYRGAKGNGTPLRIEKQPPYPAAPLQPPRATAEIQFGSRCTTNGLIPVHAGPGSDGEIFPASVQGVDCQQLVRKPGKTDAYLYLQIVADRKEGPITNGLVVVEFFDPSSAGRSPGRLIIQYDHERGGPYANTQALPLTANERWQEATFYLTSPVFQNRENSGADLRLSVNRPELAIRSVKLMKNVPIPEMKMPAVIMH